MSNVKGTKKVAAAILAVGAIVGLTACNSNSTPASSSGSSHVTTTKASEPQEDKSTILMGIIGAKDAGIYATESAHFACYARNNNLWGNDTQSERLALKYLKEHPDTAVGAYFKKYVINSESATYDSPEYHAAFVWTQEANEYVNSQSKEELSKRGSECIRYEYMVNHPFHF